MRFSPLLWIVATLLYGVVLFMIAMLLIFGLSAELTAIAIDDERYGMAKGIQIISWVLGMIAGIRFVVFVYDQVWRKRE